jgi:hypothetical protein
MVAEEDKTSITVVKFVGLSVIVAKLNGTLGFYKLDLWVSYSANELKSGSAKPRRGTYDIPEEIV